ncbi:hypothetical protein PSJ8397_03063 [Pseudooctadecabacter jejudonensis]|uniref:Uncharacterized protein n=1 Tax=Pseudooctadecabacter jejudonensis TaxID=1391910 RepID=A0A1Y5TE37_9RHOB|nr:hypothetical protein PSJ8397_03063 [Pseudooctadecabacter jejudonensis]
MITMVGAFPALLLASGLGVQALPMGMFITLTGLAAAGGM